MMRRLLLVTVLVLTACAGTPSRVSPPPAHGRFSYQIGGAYRPVAGVAIVDRDRSDPPAAHRYSICYVNAYQAQTAEVGWWRRHHDALLLRDAAGRPVVDTGWREPLLDISTAAKRRALARIVGRWIDGCATRGYRAVEADNLDSYTRSHHVLSAADALAYARLLVRRAHADGLALAQKNAAGLSVRARRAGFDFAIAEECQVYEECGAYTRVYGDRVIEIEYTDQPLAAFATACQRRGGRISVVLRDRDVTPAGDPHHVERWCRQAGAN
jgi:glycosyl hydrolase family 114